PRVSYQATGQVAGAHGGALRVDGYYRPDNREWLASIALRGFDAPYWSRYVGLGPSLSILRGRADAELVATSSPRGRHPLGQGSIHLTQTTMRIAGLGQPLTGATLEVAGMPDYLVYSGSGTVAGAP